MNKQTIFALIIAVALVGGVVMLGDFSERSDGDENTGVVLSAVQEVYAALPERAKPYYYQQSHGLTKPVPERLIELDQLTIGCFGSNTVMRMSSEDNNLGGQCCGVLKDIEAYEAQLPALHAFIEEKGNIELIPRDPYDVSVEHAQMLIGFDNDIALSPAQQQIYYDAVSLSHHGGPCCCRCWKWYMMSGLGKKLIVDYGWNSEQLAELWDLSSSCGHSEDTNMLKHYQAENDGSDSEDHH